MRAFAASLCLLAAGSLPAATNADKPARVQKSAHAAISSPKTGIKIPGIQIPFANLKPEAEFAVETPGWIAAGDSVFVPNPSKDQLLRIDPKTNKLLDPVSGLHKPCAGPVLAFDTLWIPNCGSQTVTRFDVKANKISGMLNTGVADVTAGLAATADSVWMITDARSTLSRIDPADNQVVGEMRLPAACNSVVFGEDSLWVTCPNETRLLRINPETNLVEHRIDVSPGPRSVAFGAKSVWVLCDKEGKVERIDPKTNKIIKTIELNVPHGAGNLAFGDGFLWVSQEGFPLTRIDPETDKERVAQQFWGEGGGLISASPGALWLSNVNQGTVWRVDPKRVIATLAE